MKELWFWRVATAVACIGWGLTWWTAEPEPVASEAEPVAERPQAPRGQGMGRGRGKGKLPRQVGSGPIDEGALPTPETLPTPEVSEESLELARLELAAERQERFLRHMEERHTQALSSLDALAEELDLSEDELAGLEEAIELRFQAMGEAFEGEGMEPDARREHMKAVVDAFEMQVVEVLGEETGALYLEQSQRPRFGRLGQEER